MKLFHRQVPEPGPKQTHYVLRFPNPERGGTTKQTYWLARDLKNFPVKVVTDTGGMKMTTVNHDIDLGASVAESLVTPPEGVTFQDMSEMMKGMPQQREN